MKLWQSAMELVLQVYGLTKSYPRDEEFGLKSQLRRAAVSIPSNIAEGLTRSSRRDKIHFLNIAQSSLSEIDAQCEVSFRLGYLEEKEYTLVEQKMSDVQMLLNGLVRSIRMQSTK